MRLDLSTQGPRFFFYTFSVVGRRPVLSRLVRNGPPVLTDAGAAVRRLWLMQHQLEPRFSALDFILMPDHGHFLQMVRSADHFAFNPLVFGHWFMQWSEVMATEEQSPIPLSDWHDYAGEVIQDFQKPVFSWPRDFWVEVSFNRQQLAAIRRYIRMNPARAFWKIDHPDMFVRREGIRHPRLEVGLPWNACGDLTLLSSPFLYLVSLTRHRTVATQEPKIAMYLNQAKNGGIPVCGFLSPAEREFERRLKALPFLRWVKTVPYGLPKHFDPSVEDSCFLSAHRELLLSSFTPEEARPFVIRRENCLAMTERTARLCQSR